MVVVVWCGGCCGGGVVVVVVVVWCGGGGCGCCGSGGCCDDDGGVVGYFNFGRYKKTSFFLPSAHFFPSPFLLLSLHLLLPHSLFPNPPHEKKPPSKAPINSTTHRTIQKNIRTEALKRGNDVITGDGEGQEMGERHLFPLALHDETDPGDGRQNVSL